MSSTDSTNALTTGNNLAGANDPRPKPHVEEWEAQRDAAEAVCLQISSRPVKYDRHATLGDLEVYQNWIAHLSTVWFRPAESRETWRIPLGLVSAHYGAESGVRAPHTSQRRLSREHLTL